ncbi:MAG: hypothetical protein V1664_01415 [Candidatus Uhrbacteria bacterium]
MEYSIAPVGGRVKAAGIGLDHLFSEEDPVALDRQLKLMIARPSLEHLVAFFPSDHARLRQVLKSVGFFRPSLKTDQGMPGNFLQFEIDPTLERSVLETRTIVRVENLAIPEPHAELDLQTIETVQAKFFAGHFEETAEMLEQLPSREAEKGRLPFFFIRPAVADQPITFGQDIVRKVEQATRRLTEQVCAETGVAQPNLIWCQPDVFILKDGTVQIERLNCPDVGLFLRGLKHRLSKNLPKLIELMTELKSRLCQTIVRAIPGPEPIWIVTRDEVLINNEDLLEIGEIEELRNGLNELGRGLCVVGLSEVDKIKPGASVVLLNLDHQHPAINHLYERVEMGEIDCFPNPRFQAACQRATGLTSLTVPERHREKFLSLIGSEPKNEAAHRTIINQIERFTRGNGLNTPIIYARVGSELVPVLHRSLHSWRQLKRRTERQAPNESISLLAVPATPDNLLLTSASGPRLHVFRFLCLGK